MAILFYILGAISFLYYIFSASYVGSYVGIYALWLLLAIVFVGHGVFFQFHIWHKIPIMLLRCYIFLVSLGVVVFIFAEGLILLKMQAVPRENTEYVIVLGAQVRGTTMTRSLRYRVERALSYYEEREGECYLVVSGGQGEGEAISEAEAMRRYLLEHGVEEDHILVEDVSTTTRENMAYSLAIIKEHQSKQNQTNSDLVGRIAVCTNDFHTYRAICLAKDAGMEQAGGLSAASDWRILPMMMVREAAAVLMQCVLR